MQRAGAVFVSGALLVALLCIVLISLMSNAVGAQQPTNEPAESSEASSCSTEADEVATFTTKDDSFGPFRITGESFEVLYEADTDRGTGDESFEVSVLQGGSPVVQSGELTEFPVTDGVLEVPDEGPGSFRLDVKADGVLDFAITVCEAGGSGGDGSGGSANADGADADADADDADADADDAKAADELQDLSCDELLVLFRAESSSGQQYGDASGFADSEVRAQIEVCLEEEIVEGTAADGDLPDTGGLSLIGLAVLGVVSAAAGLSVIRGGRR